MFENFKAGWKIGIFSFQFIFDHCKLLLFPVLSGLFISLSVWIAWSKGIIYILNDTSQYKLYYACGIGIVCYFITIFITVFFKVATVFTVNNYLLKKPALISEAIYFAFSKFTSILMWTLLYGTVGVLIALLEKLEEKIKTHLISDMLKMTWSIVTYFVVPVICFKDKINPFLLIKESTSTVKDIWTRDGQFNRVLGAEAVIGALTLFIYGSYYCVIKFYDWIHGLNSSDITISITSSLGILFVLTFIILAMLYMLNDAILQTIFYRYLKENFIPPDLNKNLLENSIITKDKSPAHKST